MMDGTMKKKGISLGLYHLVVIPFGIEDYHDKCLR